MTEKKEKKHALYLINPDTEKAELVHADDVEDKKEAGWKEPEGLTAGGEEWNREEVLPGQDIAADFAKQKAEADAKKAQEALKEQEKAKADADKANAKK